MSRGSLQKSVFRRLALWILCGFAVWSPATAAFAACGFEDGDLLNADGFKDTEPGTLVLKVGARFVYLRRDRCARFASAKNDLHFYVNHLHITRSSEPAFLSVHVAILNPSNLQNVIYLYRNSKRNSRWEEDSDSSDYENVLPAEISHAEFNRDLSLSRDQFEKKYASSARKWNDRVRNGSMLYDTWDTRSTFKVRDDMLARVLRHDVGLRTQDYFINFTTSDSEEIENAPDFEVHTGGAKCIFVRISGSPNIADAVGGEYTIAFNGTEVCQSTIRDLRGIGFFEWIFGYRN